MRKTTTKRIKEETISFDYLFILVVICLSHALDIEYKNRIFYCEIHSIRERIVDCSK